MSEALHARGSLDSWRHEGPRWFIRPESDPTLQIAILGMRSVAAEFIVLAAYGVLAAAASIRVREPRFARLTNRVSGAMLVGAGAGIGLAGSR